MREVAVFEAQRPLIILEFVTSPSVHGEDYFSLNAIELVYAKPDTESPRESNEGRVGSKQSAIRRLLSFAPQENDAGRMQRKQGWSFLRKSASTTAVTAKPTTGRAPVAMVHDVELSTAKAETPHEASDRQVREGQGSDTTLSLSRSCDSSDDSNDGQAIFRFLSEVRLADTFYEDEQSEFLADIKFRSSGDIVQPALSDLTGEDDDEDVECPLKGKDQPMSELLHGNSVSCGSVQSDGVVDCVTTGSTTLSGHADPFLAVEFVQIFS
mmetsp:Transcript_28160/g.77408  ORF Transcript_28160/g.77408 Transcript_28160/m.77408 type:complete len:268 (-) Transcript_28160:1626-2429(-)